MLLKSLWSNRKIGNCQQSNKELIEFVKEVIFLSIRIKLLWYTQLDCFPLLRPQVEMLHG